MCENLLRNWVPFVDFAIADEHAGIYLPGELRELMWAYKGYAAMRKFIVGSMLCALVAFCGWSNRAHADSALFLDFSGTAIPGDTYEPNVSALFHIDNTSNILTVKSTYNDSTTPLDAQSQTLTGWLWRLATNVTLTPLTAMVANSSTVVNILPEHIGVTADTKDVSGEWAFKNGPLHVSGAGNFDFAISTVGSLEGNGIFGAGDLFDGTKNLTDPPSGAPNGTDWGQAPESADLTADGLPTGGPYIQNMAIFRFMFDDSGASSPFHASQIEKVLPFFGSDGVVVKSPPDMMNVVPEPSSWALLAMGSIGLIGFRWRKRKKQAARAC